jgi:hypothetical protein
MKIFNRNAEFAVATQFLHYTESMPPFSGNFIEHIFQRQAQST